MHEISPPTTLAEGVTALLDASRRVLLVAADPAHAQQRLRTLAAAATRLEHQLAAARAAGHPVDWAATVRAGATSRGPGEDLAAWVAQRRTAQPRRLTARATTGWRPAVPVAHRPSLG